MGPPLCWCLHACLPACEAPAISGSRQRSVGHSTGAAAGRIRRPRDSLGLRRTADADAGPSRPWWVSVAAAPTLMWVVARWGAGHARDRKREPLYATRPSHMVGAPTRQPRRASASAARPHNGGAEEVKADFVSEEIPFCDSANLGRVGFSGPSFLVLERSIRVGRSPTARCPHGNLNQHRVRSPLSPFGPVPLLYDPIGSDVPNKLIIRITNHRATISSRYKQTNRPGYRCVSRAPLLFRRWICV